MIETIYTQTKITTIEPAAPYTTPKSEDETKAPIASLLPANNIEVITAPNHAALHSTCKSGRYR